MAATSLSVVSSATANRGGIPVWVGAPEVRGLNEVDRKLSVRIPAGSYTYTPTLDYARPTLAWQWKRDGAAITGATDPFYLTTSADLGKAITCTVTLTGENGSASATSGATIKYAQTDPFDSNIWSDTTNTNVIQANTATTTINLKTTGGWKTSKTTGSMTAGNPTLTVADASGFSIGDKIIVATGGEAGAGAWGTLGVGGTSPSLNYADAAAMLSDTGQASGKLAWIRSTGFVFQWNGSSWNPLKNGSSDLFYWARAVPKALVTTITNKVGNTLTLNANALVNTTNANVYFDVSSVSPTYFDYYSGASGNRRLYLPAGDYATSTTLGIGAMDEGYFYGDGPTQSIIFSPDGVPSVNLTIGVAHRWIVKDLGFRGNHKLNSWYVDYYDESTLNIRYSRGVQISRAFDTLVMNCRSEGTMNDAFITQAQSNDTVFKSLTCRHVVPIRCYLQWSLNIADSSDCSMIDCSVDSDYIVPGIECFRSDRINILRFTGKNAIISTNTSGAFYIDIPSLTFTANSIYNYDPDINPLSQNWYPQGVLININTNIGNTSGIGLDLASNGGSVLNPTVTTEGYMDATYKIRNKCIVVAPAYQAVMIRGGTITVPIYESPGNECYGVISDGDGFTVSGTRFVGFSGPYDYSVFARNATSQGHGRVFTCVGENFVARVSRRNQTNAAYIAAGGG